ITSFTLDIEFNWEGTDTTFKLEQDDGETLSVGVSNDWDSDTASLHALYAVCCTLMVFSLLFCFVAICIAILLLIFLFLNRKLPFDCGYEKKKKKIRNFKILKFLT